MFAKDRPNFMYVYGKVNAKPYWYVLIYNQTKTTLYREGECLDWYPDCCLASCKRAKYVLREWKFQFTCYEDERLECMRKM